MDGSNVIFDGFFVRRGQIELAIKKNKQLMMVSKLGYEYTTNGDVSTLPSQLATRGIGRTPSMSNVISGTFHDHQFRFFDYASNKGLLRCMYELDTNNRFPTLVLDSRKNTRSQFSYIDRVEGVILSNSRVISVGILIFRLKKVSNRNLGRY